ncbi:MAG TPA: cyclase family protein [Gemmatimonadaceae bacterium]|nr:cyclase family protein [Gemmatimonadaceae bacterium]
MIDISVLLRPGTPEWPGDTPWSCGWTAELSKGSTVNLSQIAGSPHVGTHADAPLHVRDGAPGSDTLPLDAFIGRAMLIDLVPAAPSSVARHPTLDDALDAYDPARDGERLLIRTGASIAGGVFPDAWPTITPALARSLTARGMRLFGVDAPSVDERDSRTLEVHHALFDGGACVLENLDLRHALAGPYELIALPLRLHALDAAPVRAVLRAQPT